LYTNLSISNYNIKNREEARKYLFKALALTNATQKEELANLNNILANMYFDVNDFHNAQIYNDKAISNVSDINDDQIKARIYKSSADIFTGLYEYEEAILAYQNHLIYRDKVTRQTQLNEEQKLHEKIDLEKAEKDVRLLKIQGEIQKLEIDQLKLKQQKDSLDLTNLNLENIKRQNEIQLLRRAEQLQTATLQNQELENERQRLELIKSRQEVDAIQKEIQLNDLARIESQQKSEIERQELALKAEEGRNELLKTEAEKITLELDNEKIRTKFARRIGTLLFLISTMVMGGLFYTRKTNKKLNQQNIEIEKNKNEIEKERKKSDQLLLNILPISVAEELKSTGKATPRLHQNVTVLFTDFVNFTKISSKLLPEDILDELNVCFTAFDEICSKYKLEKIKTIGDGYLAVSGLPIALEEAAFAAANASLEMMTFMKNRADKLSIEGKDYWALRIGLHSGNVVAGVLGTSKFVYDIWGDTVNTASRMESNSVPGKINVSDSTYNQLKNKFAFEYRGEIKAKNKGAMKMYFLEKK
jgi:class 3 adenylate cyclase